MFINKKRIRNVHKYLTGFKEGESVRIILSSIDTFEKKLFSIGFDKSLSDGDSVLPTVLGSVSSYNANGKYKILYDLPKITFYVSRYQTIKAFGKYDVEVSMDIPYKRFPREFIDAPSQELTIVLDDSNNKIVSSDLILVNEGNYPAIKHIINLFLELFGECNIVDEKLLSRVKTPIKRVNWHILPKGITPWETLEKELLVMLEGTKPKRKLDALNRFHFINSFSPDFLVTGNGGFNDYVVFGFSDKNIYVLENSFAGNATYVFENDWAFLSQLTKAEILKENLQKDRLIHQKNWTAQIKKMLS